MADFSTFAGYLLKGFHGACCIGNYLCDGVGTLLHFNYVMVSSVLNMIAYVTGALKAVALSITVALAETMHKSMEVWKEIVNIAGLAFDAGAGVGRYICLGIVTSLKWIVKTLLPWLWNSFIKISLSVWKGILYCLNTITSSFYSATICVADAVQVGTKVAGDAILSVTEYSIESVRSFIVAFNLLCNTAMTYCLEIWVTVVILVSQIYEGIIEKFISVKHCVVVFLEDLWFSKLGSISSDVYLIISLAILCYFIAILVFRQLDSRGFTFPSLRQRNPTLENILEESDAENLMDDNDDDIGISDSDSDQESIAGSVASHASFTSVASNHSHVSRQSNISNHRYNLRERTPQLPVEPDALARALEQERDRRRCVVCQDQSKNVLLLPCRHMCMCSPCAQTITRTALIYRRICPLCRAPIEAIMSVFV